MRSYIDLKLNNIYNLKYRTKIVHIKNLSKQKISMQNFRQADHRPTSLAADKGYDKKEKERKGQPAWR